jgi:F-type H+-transporting ATP synthase subunit e
VFNCPQRKPNLPTSDNSQVVRYTALFAGVVYGWYHRRSLQATYNEHKLQDATHHRERLIVQAKEAWKRKQDNAKGATRMFFSSLSLAGYMKDAHISLRSHHGPG